MVTKEEIKRIMATPGKARGVIIVSSAKYILEKKGPEGLKKVEEEMEKMGYPIKHEKIDPLGWYPMGLWVIWLLAIQKAFNWQDKEIFEMGNNLPKFSIIVKMFFKYFVSLKKSCEQASYYWRKHYTTGKISLPEFHEDKKWFVVRVEEMKIHPIVCVLLAGYFLRMVQYVLKSPKIEVKEIKCMHKGDSYHDFLLTWE